ncbi:RNA-binding domain superfamily [Arabidopsis thaliana x Arabidopsis arenosa]|uniref:RNA-binding domain superfamily n=1 Tax=Arabidopsis thaliana x Arabidopsis arenosa TaxID=1240361 RepID=A0A8T2BSE3_9BRAS|nr:RNA-binding domain superfamily [Arabidopsis thaliana x Arabidopsis arenosa]
MNGATLCNSVLLHSRFQSSFSFKSSSSSSSSSAYLVSPSLTKSKYISISHRIRQSFRAVLEKRSNGFCSFAVKKRNSELMDNDGEEDDDDDDDDDEDWGEFDEEDEGEEEDEDEGELLPMDKMKKWLEKKPRGFGLGKKYETSIEDKLLDEIQQSWKAQAANLNKLKNDPLKSQQLKRDDNLIKGTGETEIGFRVRVTNLPKKKNVHRDLKVAFKEVSGVLCITPAVSGNKKTKDPVCKGFAHVDFKSEIDANRFVKQFTGQSLAFGKVIKQIKCQVVEFTSDESVSKEVYLDNGFKVQKLTYSGLEGDSYADVVEEEAFLSSGEESDVSDEEVEDDERNHISSSIESSPVELRCDSKTELKFEKQFVKREIREHEELETLPVSFQANKSEEAVAETRLDDEQSEEAVAETFLDDELDGDDVEVAEENLELLNSSLSSSEENRVDRIRRLEQKLLGKEKLLGGGVGFDKPEAKPARVEGKKKEKKKKTKILVKGQAKKSSKIEIPGSSKRLKVKEKALLTGVLVKYAAKVASTSNNE